MCYECKAGATDFARDAARQLDPNPMDSSPADKVAVPPVAALFVRAAAEREVDVVAVLLFFVEICMAKQLWLGNGDRFVWHCRTGACLPLKHRVGVSGKGGGHPGPTSQMHRMRVPCEAVELRRPEASCTGP